MLPYQMYFQDIPNYSLQNDFGKVVTLRGPYLLIEAWLASSITRKETSDSEFKVMKPQADGFLKNQNRNAVPFIAFGFFPFSFVRGSKIMYPLLKFWSRYSKALPQLRSFQIFTPEIFLEQEVSPESLHPGKRRWELSPPPRSASSAPTPSLRWDLMGDLRLPGDASPAPCSPSWTCARSGRGAGPWLSRELPGLPRRVKASLRSKVDSCPLPFRRPGSNGF